MKRRESRCGLTMVELSAVMAIIIMITTIVVGLAKLAAVKGDRARTNAAMKKIENALDRYTVERGQAPVQSTAGPFTATHQAALNLFGGDLNYTDAWGNAFWYQSLAASPRSYYIWSFGPNGNNDARTGDDISNQQSE